MRIGIDATRLHDDIVIWTSKDIRFQVDKARICEVLKAYRDLPHLYSGADLFAYLSLYEGFGMPVLEAMACGTPVLASDATSIPEVAGSAAALVDPTDCRAIAYSLVEILTDPERKRELRAAGRDRVASFSWEKTARELWCL